MAQTILLKRGTEVARTTLTAPTAGELITTTDNYNELFVGDGATVGGNPLAYLSTRLGGTVGGSVIISGDLTVNGTTTSINSNEVNIGDAIILLNADETAAPSQNAGIEIERGTSVNVSVLWDETAEVWTLSDETSTRRILDADDILTSGTGISIIGGVVANTDLGSSQNIFKTFTADSGTATADINADTLTITGGTAVATAIVGDTLTITSSDTTYTAGVGLSLTGDDFSLDFSELTDMVGAVSATTEFILQDGTTESRKAASEIDLGTLNNNLGWTSNTGTVTSVSGGAGLTGTITTTGSLEVGAGTGITVNADTIQVSDNGISALQLNIVGNGTAGQVISSDADGSFSWIAAPSGTTNLGYTPSPTNGTVTSSTGSDATLTLADTTNAGLLSPAFFDDLNAGVITSVIAGAGMTGGNTSGAATVNVIAGDTSLIVSADSMVVGTVDGGTF